MDGKSKFEGAGERVAKAIARAGVGSRREAEQWIAAGRVAVNGAVIDSPARNVAATDRISIDGKPLPARERTRLFLYHKPRRLVTARADPQGRPTVFERLPKELPRLVSVGRLDFNSEGLLLLTNDGGLARALELPATGWLRRYRVRAHGAVTQARLDELRAGATVDGVHYRPVEATLDRVQGSNLWLTVALREGKNREVRNVLGGLGLKVTRLIRVSFGPFQLGELPAGAVEEVRTRVLREQLGARVVALASADFSASIATPPAPEKDAAPQRPPQDRSKSRRPKDHGAKDHGAKSRGSTSHSWRMHADERPAKKLRRKFHGSRRDDGSEREQRTRAPRAGLIADRAGRRILVERLGAPPSPPSPPSRPPPKHGPRDPRHGAARGRRRPRSF